MFSHRVRELILMFIIIILILPNEIAPEEVIVELHAFYFEAAPDGVKTQVLGINGHFPGPTIRAKLNDTLRIRVTNSIKDKDGKTYPTSVHWHGIEQVGTPWEDGPEGVTQCPIPYDHSMEYRFTLNQTGTYWYHSHHTWQYVEGFWGILIVDNLPEVQKYDAELSISLSDWHHTPAKILSEKYHIKNTSIPIPDTGLINGRGAYPCGEARNLGLVCDPSLQSPALLRIFPERVYRVRVINVAARANFRFSIDGHKLYAIEVDGVDTVSVGPVDFVEIWPAQRYSFLVTMNGNLDGYWIRANMSNIGSNIPQLHNAKAILQYDRESCPPPLTSSAVNLGQIGTQGRPETHNIDWDKLVVDVQSGKKRWPIFSGVSVEGYTFSLSAPPIDVTKGKVADEKHRKALASIPLPTTNQVGNPKELNDSLCRPISGQTAPSVNPKGYDKLIVLTATFNTNGPTILAKINGGVYKADSSRPVIVRMMKNESLNPSSNPQYTPTMGKVIQVVINNNNGGSHPWHLHGHTFWVLGSGPGIYNESQHSNKLRLDGVRRDTTRTSAGSWVVIRYVTDNPGAWLLHCHINWHLEIGLGAVFIEGEEVFRTCYDIPEEASKVCAANGIDL